MLFHKTNKILKNGNAKHLGATVSALGVNFAIYSKHAQEVYLLLFDDAKSKASDVIKLEHKTNNIWHVFVSDLKPGQLYGYKIKGPYDLVAGHRFNEHKLLLDPYAKAFTDKCCDKDDLIFAFDKRSLNKDLSLDKRDNTMLMPKSVVVDDEFDWEGVSSPDLAMNELIIYETHLKGFTAHSSSKVKNPGTYLGFIEKIPYLKELGINAVEFLPVHEFYVNKRLAKLGLNNYWGYDTVSYFAPEISYSSKESYDSPVREFKTLVKELHKAGIEVILDVVYNHTAEGNEFGPTFSFKGIDNSEYYCLIPDAKKPNLKNRHYINDSGCGNTIKAENHIVTRLIVDSLRYWAEVMHVDGFRFDLASILGKSRGNFKQDCNLFKALAKDPVLSKKKLIAEPWDLSSYQVGNFPVAWSEWNGKFRDTMRRFLKGDDAMVGEFATRISGSSDLYNKENKGPYKSINFITCHDGFTLKDLYSYNHKHNKANGENNRDGCDHNDSWNCGVEGRTNNVEIINLRRKMCKNAIFSLLFAKGVPMILYGDELLRSQNGNNNTYCQDNKLSWMDWSLVKKNTDMLDFCKRAIAFRKEYSVLQTDKYIKGNVPDVDGIFNMHWFDKHLNDPAWDNHKFKTLAYQLAGDNNEEGRSNYYLYFVFNMHHQGCSVFLPEYERIEWFRVVDTSRESGDDFIFNHQKTGKHLHGHSHHCAPRTCMLFLGKRL